MPTLHTAVVTRFLMVLFIVAAISFAATVWLGNLR